MIENISWLWREVLRSRLGDLFNVPTLLAVLIGIAAAMSWINHNLGQFSEIIEPLVTWSAIGLGFSLTAVAIILSSPNKAFLRQLAPAPKIVEGEVKKTEHEKLLKRSRSAENLLFVFIWTSLVFLALIVLVSAYMIGFRIFSQEVNVVQEIRVVGVILGGVIAGLVFYSVAQIFFAILAIHRFGVHYVRHQYKEDGT